MSSKKVVVPTQETIGDNYPATDDPIIWEGIYGSYSMSRIYCLTRRPDEIDSRFVCLQGEGNY